MLRRTYDWLLAQSAKPGAMWVMGAISFAESSFFPMPPDIMMIPMIVENRRRAFWIATVATLTSVLGSYLGYAIGHYFYAAVGEKILAMYGLSDRVHGLIDSFNQYGMEIILLKGMTPIPFKLVTIASGIAHFDLLKFTIACFVSRAVRFYLVAALLFFIGEPAREFIEKRLTLVTTVIVVLLVGGVVALKFL